MIELIVREFLVPLLLFLLLRVILRNFMTGLRGAARPRARAPQGPSAPAVGVLKKDPVCGTYVSTETSIQLKMNGEVLHFCSQACREKYGAGNA